VYYDKYSLILADDSVYSGQRGEPKFLITFAHILWVALEASGDGTLNHPNPSRLNPTIPHPLWPCPSTYIRLWSRQRIHH